MTWVRRAAFFLFAAILYLTCPFGTSSGSAAEPYVITIQKLELKEHGGDWVKIIEPDHNIDLMTDDAMVSFFNDGRVPEADFDNFRLTFNDHGQEREISRRSNYDRPVPVRKGSFIHVSFTLEFEGAPERVVVRSGRVKELRLTIDDVIRIEDERTLKS